ncbi:hypothetical protein GF412_03765 [Candidatus Micrarchaeota archaeon]|nr:hypothetical protein [Candidatus Micrarchaeota archaeon]MBD3418067.1 hypothetical protein [Candidatus Micrarchaeota archaeon]
MNIAEVVGLWLAEGWRNSRYEITITNNCLELIKGSYQVLGGLFEGGNFRAYAYLPSKGYGLKETLPVARVRKYVDSRARKPYYILRLGSVEATTKWKKLVVQTCQGEENYADILRGFFAGEGNIKTGSHSNRAVRIAQKEPSELIDLILSHFEIEKRFEKRGRSYAIVGRRDWEKLAKIRIADLHPDKKKKFWNAYQSYSQWHYKKHHIHNNILECLNRPKTSKELAEEFGRSQARLQDILMPLKTQGVLMCYKLGAGKPHYWVRVDSRQIPISARKKKILDSLVVPKRALEIALDIGVNRKILRDHLQTLERLSFIRREGKYWVKLETNKEVIVID